MSAIWGIINSKKAIDPSTKTKLDTSMAKYKFDRISAIPLNCAYFACGHQYITKVSESDVSPIEDNNRHIIFCGDCFLYNRQLLIEDLSNIKSNEIPQRNELLTSGDNQLAYYAYLVYKENFVNHLRGSFSFAIYCQDSNLLHLYSDHFLNRYLTYYISNDYVCFGTITAPIVSISSNLTLNRKFLLDTFRVISPMGFFDYESTQYEEVFHLSPAQHVTINLNTLVTSKETYWTPKNIRKNKSLTHDEYKSLFVNIYRNTVESMLCSQGNIGIMLSGGLDSSSVAALAAPYLSQRGKKLYSYTQVPADDYTIRKSSDKHENESYFVQLQCERFGNIIPHYVSSGDKNCFDVLKDTVDYFQFPVKTIANGPHMMRMFSAASEDNCRVLLNGGNGNASISYGFASDILFYDLKSFRFFKFKKDITDLCKLSNSSRKEHLVTCFKGIWDSLKRPVENTSHYYKKDIKKYSLNHPSLDFQRRYGSSVIHSNKQIQTYHCDELRFIQNSLYNTYYSLITGVLSLDPTQTVEIVELCMSLPMDCYFKDGLDRYLVRGYMKELIPEQITDVFAGRGVQGADFEYCFNRDYSRIKEAFLNAYDEPLIKEYINSKHLADLRKSFENPDGDISRRDIWLAMMYISLGYFLRDYEERKASINN